MKRGRQVNQSQEPTALNLWNYMTSKYTGLPQSLARGDEVQLRRRK